MPENVVQVHGVGRKLSGRDKDNKKANFREAWARTL